LIYPIRYYGDPILRKVATPVRRFDQALATLAADMLETMYHYSGVGLAAPQIGLGKRLFVALELGLVENDVDGDDTRTDDDTPLSTDEKRKRWGVVREHVMVNPIVLERRGQQFGQEGCLSIPGIYVEALRRDAAVRVRFQDVHGEHHELTAEGHFAHVIQHELDHLDGVLFFDRLPEQERQAFLEHHRKALAEIQRDAKAQLRQLKEQPLANVR
jgi:peptide deformylase